MNRREYAEILFNSALSPMQKLLYAYLRANMDWRTCIVGDADKKMISRQAIREHLEYLPPAKSHAERVELSRDQVKRLIAALEKAGYIVRLKGQRYGRELRFFLPLASSGQKCPEDERPMSARHERPGRSEAHCGLQGHERPMQNHDERPTSYQESLSLNTTLSYTHYDPDSADWSWLKYLFGEKAIGPLLDVQIETEKFNLRRKQDAEADPRYVREAWRTWMIRAYEYASTRNASLFRQ